jgi:hypothetical protein
VTIEGQHADANASSSFLMLPDSRHVCGCANCLKLLQVVFRINLSACEIVFSNHIHNHRNYDIIINVGVTFLKIAM